MDNVKGISIDVERTAVLNYLNTYRYIWNLEKRSHIPIGSNYYKELYKGVKGLSDLLELDNLGDDILDMVAFKKYNKKESINNDYLAPNQLTLITSALSELNNNKFGLSCKHIYDFIDGHVGFKNKPLNLIERMFIKIWVELYNLNYKSALKASRRERIMNNTSNINLLSVKYT